MAEQEEFKFPDESGKDGPDTEKLKIEVVDDTPPEDRGREPLPEKVKEELDKDDLGEYSEKVQQRMKALKKAWHDERRAKEAEAREKQEALRFAQAREEENKQLKQRIGTGEKIFITEVTAAAKTQLESARAKLKAAYEAGDAGQIADAQEALTDAKFKIQTAENYKPSLQDEKSGVQANPQAQTPAPQQQQAPDLKAEAWKQKNSWFGADVEMTSLALGLHEKLVKSGVRPDSDEYYRQIDTTMRKRFPENFEEPAEKEPVHKPATVVAPASRSTAPRQVRLTASQVALAKRLGLTPEAYAREMIKLENQNV